MTIEDLKLKIDDAINDVFYEVQTAEGIDNGEIDFKQAFELDMKEEEIAKIVLSVLEYQKAIMQTRKGEK